MLSIPSCITRCQRAAASYLVCFHRLADPVTGSVVNDLQVLVNGGLEPVMKASQGQHLRIPVQEQHVSLINSETRKGKKRLNIHWRYRKQQGLLLELNQLEREKLSEAFEDFQGHEELKDGLSHCLRQSAALLLQSPAHPLHGYIYIISYLKDERLWLSIKVSNNTCNFTLLVSSMFFNDIPVSPAACTIC